MKRFITYSTIILAAAISLSSCKNFLTKDPKLSQSTELTLSSFEGLDKATLGAYSYLGNVGWYGGVKVLTSEMMSGNGIKDMSHTSNRYITELNWNYTPDGTSSQWAYSYLTIARANNVIDNLEGKTSATVTEQDLKNLKAECLFIRALSHFDCVLTYAQPYTYKKDGPGVPVVLHTDASARPARNTVAEVYNQIVTDLLEAESIIDPDYKRAGVNSQKAVVSIAAIQGLLSRVYLYMGEWNNAAAYATKVIENSKYSLYTTDEYKSSWGLDEGGKEVIFEAYKDLSNRSLEDCGYMVDPDGGYGDCICSPELYAMYKDGDVRKEMYKMDENSTPGLYWTCKYPGKGTGSSPDPNNVPIIRLSEMYLNRAEAGVNGAAGVDALADINAVAEKRGADKYLTVSIVDVQKERRKELAWEGHHLYDMARWNKSIERTADAFLNEVNAKIPFPSYRWALPIPQSEREVNPNLTQNEGYAN